MTLLSRLAEKGLAASMEQHNMFDPLVGFLPIDVVKAVLLTTLQHVPAHGTLSVLSSPHLADKLVYRLQLKQFLAVAEASLPFGVEGVGCRLDLDVTLLLDCLLDMDQGAAGCLVREGPLVAVL